MTARILGILLLLLCLLIFGSCGGQSPKLPPLLEGRSISGGSKSYSAMLCLGRRLYTVTDQGRLLIWDLDLLDTVPNGANLPNRVYKSIAKDRANEIYLGAENGNVYRLESTGQATKVFHSLFPILGIAFNKANQMYVLNPYGVRDAVSHKQWSGFVPYRDGYRSDRSKYYVFPPKDDGYFYVPDFHYLDGRGQWWMCAGFGEFGSVVEVFDVENGRVVKKPPMDLDLALIFTQSLFEDAAGNLYLSSGLQHMMNWGEIYQIDAGGHARMLWDGVLEADSIGKRNRLDAIFVGPGAVNPHDGCLYFSSNLGFFKMEIPTAGAMAKPVPLFRPQLHWVQEPMAVGVAMSIEEMLFDDQGRLIFRTSRDGIGIWDGKELVFLQ